jgi:hypothetical protein
VARENCQEHGLACDDAGSCVLCKRSERSSSGGMPWAWITALTLVIVGLLLHVREQPSRFLDNVMPGVEAALSAAPSEQDAVEEDDGAKTRPTVLAYLDDRHVPGELAIEVSSSAGQEVLVDEPPLAGAHRSSKPHIVIIMPYAVKPVIEDTPARQSGGVPYGPGHVRARVPGVRPLSKPRWPTGGGSGEVYNAGMNNGAVSVPRAPRRRPSSVKRPRRRARAIRRR